MAQTWTILEKKFLNLIQTFEEVTLSVLEMSEVSLMISTFSLNLVIFKKIPNELCRYVLFFWAAVKTQVHMLYYPQVPDQPKKC